MKLSSALLKIVCSTSMTMLVAFSIAADSPAESQPCCEQTTQPSSRCSCCSATTTQPARLKVRGQVVRFVPPKAGEQFGLLEVNHEAIPDVMHAMRMKFRIAPLSPEVKLHANDKIEFELSLADEEFTIEAVVQLDASTVLKLAPAASTQAAHE